MKLSNIKNISQISSPIWETVLNRNSELGYYIISQLSSEIWSNLFSQVYGKFDLQHMMHILDQINETK